jgi:thymidylate kinase
MLIEFIGSTGAGKTTLISEVQHRLTKTAKVTTSYDFVAAPLGLRGVTHPTAQNFIQELVGFPFFIRSLHRNKAFVVFILRMLARQSNFSIFTINNLRSLVRKIGVFEIIRRDENNHIIMVDEGTVLLAHNVFVYNSVSYAPDEITTFVDLAPLPDLVVYIRAPMDSLMKRALRRSDPPREIKSKNRALIETYVERAVSMFEQLIQAEKIRDRVLIVENPESADTGHDTVVDYIAQFIQNNEPASKSV